MFSPKGYPNHPMAALATAALIGVGSWTLGLHAFQSPASSFKDPASKESDRAKIERAILAAPPNVAKDATVADMDGQGNLTILRPGTNGFTCMPGNSKVIGKPPMCADAASMQWFADFKAHKPKPTNTVPGITYMLAGATQRSDSDPYDTTSPPITVPPHWMIMWPFDAKNTGLPVTHRDCGAYIMWSGSPYAHLHIMGKP